MGNGASSISSPATKYKNNPNATVFIDFETFKSQGSIPRNPDCESVCTQLGDIDREQSLVVFVSHVWVSGADDEAPTPDDGTHSKYKLLVNGLTRFIDECAPQFQKCYLWLDYSCLNQDGKPIQQLGQQLDSIIQHCDCLFTPLPGRVTSDLSYTAKFSDTQQPSWNTPGSGYLHRAWCRTEMFYACNIPTFPDTNSRIDSFKLSLKHFANIGKRPHYVYGPQQEEEDAGPIRVPLLQNTLLKQLTPEYGINSVSEDHIKIMELTSKLKPHIERNGEGYFGELRNQKMHGKGLLRFDSGAMYQGDFAGGKKHGSGTFVYATGNVYTGGWVDDLKHGVGDFRFVTGNTYNGHFRLDKKNGQGLFRWMSGESYEGQWVDDRKHGKGCMKFKDGSEYSGEYFEDQIEGEGSMKYTNGDVYVGDFVDGKRYGHGELRFENGDVYTGQLIGGAMQGRGTLATAGGKEVYEGNFYDSERNGHGSCRYTDGEYVGQWLDGHRHGQGTFTARVDDIYAGDWAHDLKHGNGIYKSPNGTYEGQYQAGKLHGKGTFTYPNGDVYTGVWLHDKKQGKGTYVYAVDGREWMAMWRDDELIEKVAID